MVNILPGSINDKLQASVAGNIRRKGLMQSCSANAAKMGTNRAEVAVFEQISVKRALKMVTIRAITQGSRPLTTSPSKFAIHVEKPNRY